MYNKCVDINTGTIKNCCFVLHNPKYYHKIPKVSLFAHFLRFNYSTEYHEIIVCYNFDLKKLLRLNSYLCKLFRHFSDFLYHRFLYNRNLIQKECLYQLSCLGTTDKDLGTLTTQSNNFTASV